MSLKTDFKDAIPASGAGTLRKYQQINNADGTVSFQDVTEYSQAGDKAQASVFNAICDAINKGAIIPLACTKSGTVYALTGLTATSGKVPVMFSVPTAYAAGDTVTIDGTAYTLKTTDGTALTAGAWAAGAIITGTADIDNKNLWVKPSNALTLGGKTESQLSVNYSASSGYAASAGSAPANGGTAANTTSISGALTLVSGGTAPSSTLSPGTLWGGY